MASGAPAATRPRRPRRAPTIASPTDAPTGKRAPAAPVTPVDPVLPGPTTPAPQAPVDPAADAYAIAQALLRPGRVSIDSWLTAAAGPQPFIIRPPIDYQGNWHSLDLDVHLLSKLPPSKAIDYLVEVSPDMGRTLYDWLRLCNPGYQVDVYYPGTKTPYEEGKAAIDTILERVAARYGGTFDVVINKLFASAYLRGALVSELVLAPDRRTVLDIATPDPMTFRWKAEKDPQLGTRYTLYQLQPDGLIDCERPTVKYVPVDPLPGNPYGRPPVAPALFTTVFLLGLLHDLRRVIAQQGWPRIDVAVALSKLAEQLPETIRDDPTKFQAWAKRVISDIQTAYARLQPEDAWIHSDAVTVGQPVGAVDSSSLSAVPGIISFLERFATRALKTMPILMGTAEGTSESNANRQWEVMTASIKAIQHLAENLLGYNFGLALRAQGLQGLVVVRFAELRAAEQLRDQQTLKLKIINLAILYDRGIITQEEMAQAIVNHAPAHPEPLYPGVGTGAKEGGTSGEPAGISGPDATNPDPGSARGMNGVVHEAEEVLREARQLVLAHTPTDGPLAPRLTEILLGEG
jgi:hypothetical protein